MNMDIVMIEEQRMSESISLSVSEMAGNIYSQLNLLDARCRYMFVKWLLAHSCAVYHSKEIRAGLIAWLGSIPAESAAWEYKLIMGEISWWQDLDEPTLTRMMLDCLRSNS